MKVSWVGIPNAKGIKPPNPQFNVLEKTSGIYYIQSKREPYAVEHLYTRYGELSSRLGTNLGK